MLWCSAHFCLKPSIHLVLIKPLPGRISQSRRSGTINHSYNSQSMGILSNQSRCRLHIDACRILLHSSYTWLHCMPFTLITKARWCAWIEKHPLDYSYTLKGANAYPFEIHVQFPWQLNCRTLAFCVLVRCKTEVLEKCTESPPYHQFILHYTITFGIN